MDLSFEASMRRLIIMMGGPELEPLATTKTGNILKVNAKALLKNVLEQLQQNSSVLISENYINGFYSQLEAETLYAKKTISELRAILRMPATKTTRIKSKTKGELEMKVRTGAEVNFDEYTPEVNEYVEYVLNDLQVQHIVPSTPSLDEWPYARRLIYRSGCDGLYRHQPTWENTEELLDDIGAYMDKVEYKRYLLLKKRVAALEQGLAIDMDAEIPPEKPKDLTKKELDTILRKRATQVLSYKVNPTYLVRFVNGIYDLRENEFIPENSEEFNRYSDYCFTVSCAFNYNPVEVTGSLITEMLDKTFLRDDHNILMLKTFLGYCLCNHIDRQVCLILVGRSASNGKSTLGNLIQQTFPLMCNNISISQLTSRFGGSEIEGRLVNISDDQTNGFIADAGIFKRLITENLMWVERKGVQGYKIRNMCKHIIFANEIMMGKGMERNDVLRRMIYLETPADFRHVQEDDWEHGIFKADYSAVYRQYSSEDLQAFINDCFQHYLIYGYLLGQVGNSSPELMNRVYKKNNHVFNWLFNTDISNICTRQEAYEIHSKWRKRNGCSTIQESNFIEEVMFWYPQLLELWEDVGDNVDYESAEWQRSIDYAQTESVLQKRLDFSKQDILTQEEMKSAKSYIRTQLFQRYVVEKQKSENTIAAAIERQKYYKQGDVIADQWITDFISAIDFEISCKQNYDIFKGWHLSETLPSCIDTSSKWITRVCALAGLSIKFDRRGMRWFIRP